MSIKKYEFTGETKTIDTITLKRIKRLSDGRLGGWIEKEENLSQEGACWVFDEAQVSGSARVSGSAQVSGLAQVSGSAQVFGLARVYYSARVSGSAQVYESAQVSGLAQVSGSARVYDSSWVSGSALVSGLAWVSGSARVISLSCLFHIIWKSYSITITPQNIAIGCRLWERGTFNKTYRQIGKDEGMNDELINQFKSIVKLGTSIVERVK